MLEWFHKIVEDKIGLSANELSAQVFNLMPEFKLETATFCFIGSMIFWPLLFAITYGFVSKFLGHTLAWKDKNQKERFYYCSYYFSTAQAIISTLLSVYSILYASG